MAYTKTEISRYKKEIIEELSEGKSLMQLIKERKDKNIKFPKRTTIYFWLNENHKNFDPVFLNDYVRAKQDSADVDAERIEKIIQEVRDKTLTPKQARVMMYGLQWIAGKKKPKKYGDKLDLTTNGNDVISQVVVFELPDNKRDKKTEK